MQRTDRPIPSGSSASAGFALSGMAGSAILSLPTSASSLPDSPSDAGTMDTPDGDLGPGLSIAMAATIAAAIKK
jgi:hypothetical protein